MNIPAVSTITILIYFSASFIQSLNVFGRITKSRWYVLGLGFVAVCLHSMLLHIWIDTIVGQNLNLFNMLSLAVWLVTVMVIVVALIKPIEILLNFVFPMAAMSILFVIVFPRQYFVNTAANTPALFHIVLSIFTFAVLCLAGLLAILLAIQERVLRYKQTGRLISSLPPLESMETLLFQVISLGFVLLTMVLATSFYFYHTLLLKHILLLQKSILAVLAWIIFAVLLVGRYMRGWRARKAINYTLAGVLLLFIAYFGSKLVLEALH